MSGLSRETLELIASWAEMLTAAFGILAATAAVVYLLANKPINKLEAHDREVLHGTVVEAQGALLVQKERADIAAGKLAGLEQDVANAKTEMAKEQTRAATAERSLLELQEKLRPRHLSPEQKKAIGDALKGFPPQQVNIFAVVGTTDGTTFGLELATAINSGGWTAKFLGVESSGGELRGIALVMKDTKHPPPGTPQLQDALKAAGLSAPMWNHPQWGGGTVIALFIAPREM
jgi:hypothetical protein